MLYFTVLLPIACSVADVLNCNLVSSACRQPFQEALLERESCPHLLFMPFPDRGEQSLGDHVSPNHICQQHITKILDLPAMLSISRHSVIA